jgi:putative membrane protein|tara:strand:+ start:3733 stop:4281 length:549 start_codon:yes stop_codon:yes gene_type:complete
MSLPSASLTKNDKKANIFIILVSAIIFLTVVILHELNLKIEVNFDPHIFAKLNAFINASVSILLILGLFFVKSKKYILHKRVMNLSIILSVFFILSYIAHHLLAESTVFGGVGNIKSIYYFVLITHIILAGLSLPFILYTAYRASIAEFAKHKKLARYVYPIWLYVAITGVVVYFLISPYYV